jgi:hypothetical protein
MSALFGVSGTTCPSRRRTRSPTSRQNGPNSKMCCVLLFMALRRRSGKNSVRTLRTHRKDFSRQVRLVSQVALWLQFYAAYDSLSTLPLPNERDALSY